MSAAAHDHRNMLPRGSVALACAMALFALGSVAVVRIARIPPSASPAAMRAAGHVAPVASRDLRFLDRRDGAVVIRDARTGGTAWIIEPGEKTGFIRGVMRGLARERRASGIGDAPPFNLTLWRDGELSLTDSATGRTIELTAFGTTNRATFAALLGGKGPAA